MGECGWCCQCWGDAGPAAGDGEASDASCLGQGAGGLSRLGTWGAASPFAALVTLYLCVHALMAWCTLECVLLGAAGRPAGRRL